ncbi:hypothetical protein FRAHR75_650028 [Frankia sp. Hr75.2]|nr:hypothetical protein FRAHR75_650028 [Frankia sp. Hr75.2]
MTSVPPRRVGAPGLVGPRRRPARRVPAPRGPLATRRRVDAFGRETLCAKGPDADRQCADAATNAPGRLGRRCPGSGATRAPERPGGRSSRRLVRHRGGLVM